MEILEPTIFVASLATWNHTLKQHTIGTKVHDLLPKPQISPLYGGLLDWNPG